MDLLSCVKSYKIKSLHIVVFFKGNYNFDDLENPDPTLQSGAFCYRNVLPIDLKRRLQSPAILFFQHGEKFWGKCSEIHRK